MATRRLPSTALVMILFAVLPRQAAPLDNGDFKQIPKQPSERDAGQSISIAGVMHERMAKSITDISHFWSLPKKEPIFFGAERTMLQPVINQNTESEKSEHVGDMENLGQVMGLLGRYTMIGARNDEKNVNIGLRVVRDTASSIERQRWFHKQMLERRRLQYQAFIKRRQQRMSASRDTSLKQEIPRAPASSGQTDLQGQHSGQKTIPSRNSKSQVGEPSARNQTTGVDRLTRLRLMRQRYWQRKAKTYTRGGQSSHKQSNGTKTKAGLPLETDSHQGQSHSFIPQTQQQLHEFVGNNDRQQKSGRKTQSISSKIHIDLQKDIQHQSTLFPFQTDAMPAKLVTESTARITSEMTSLYPFIDSTRALNYLNNFSSRPLPRRWPLKLILEDTATSSPTQSLSREVLGEQKETAVDKQRRRTPDHPSTTSKPVDLTDRYKTDGFPFVTPKASFESNPYKNTVLPHDNGSVPQPDSEHVTSWGVQVSPTPIIDDNHQSSNPRPKVVLGGRWWKRTVKRRNKTNSRPRALNGQSFHTHSRHENQNMSIGMDMAKEDKTVVYGVVEAKKVDNPLDSYDGSGDEEGTEIVFNRSKLTAMKTIRKRRKQNMRNAGRQRKARSRRKGKKRRNGKKSKRTKNRTERRAARKRRRRMQRLRRKRLRRDKKKKRVKNGTKSNMSGQSRRAPLPTHPYLSSVKTTNHTGFIASLPKSVFIKAGDNASNNGSQKTLLDKINTTIWSNVVPTQKSSEPSPREHVGNSSKSLILRAHAPNASVSSVHAVDIIQDNCSSVTHHPNDRVASTTCSDETDISNATFDLKTKNVSKASSLLPIVLALSPLPSSSPVSNKTLTPPTIKTSSHTVTSVNESINVASRSRNGAQSYNMSTVAPFRPTIESFYTKTSFSAEQQPSVSENRDWKHKDGSQKAYAMDERSSTPQPTQEVSKTTVRTLENEKQLDQNQSDEKGSFIGYKTAYDFLSNQKVVRKKHQSEAVRELRESHRAMSDRLCKVFKKRFVPSGIGGRCV